MEIKNFNKYFETSNVSDKKHNEEHIDSKLTSENYLELLLNEYENQEMSKEDLLDTLKHYAKLYHNERVQETISENVDVDEKIDIKTGSHVSNKEHNREQYEVVKNILFDKSNPHRNLFEEEELFLDDTNGLISIIEYTYSDIDREAAKEIYEYLKSNFKENMDKILVFIGSHTFGLK